MLVDVHECLADITATEANASTILLAIDRGILRRCSIAGFYYLFAGALFSIPSTFGLRCTIACGLLHDTSIWRHCSAIKIHAATRVV
jgi:hypothetical protein